MKLGQCAQEIFPKTHTLQEASWSYLLHPGILGCADNVVIWVGLASSLLPRSLTTKIFPFNIGWWGFTFPLGVFATSTCQMGSELPSKFFDILGTV